MNESNPSHSVAIVGGLDAGHVSHLLSLGIRGPRRPVDRLVDRLQERDGKAWLERSITSLPQQEGYLAAGLFSGPIADLKTGLEALKALKAWCKRRAGADSDSLEPLLGYFLCLGAALAHYGTLISAMPRREIDGVLLDLAVAMPEPWCELLCQATLRKC